MKGSHALQTSLGKRTPSVLFGFLWLLASLFLLISTTEAATVKSVRLGENADQTRLVLDIDGSGTGVIEAYRYGQFQPGTSRVVLDLKEPAAVDRIFILPPQSGYKYRLVVDLRPVAPSEFLVAMQKSASAVPVYTPQNNVNTPKPMPSKRTIVLDAGHGGVDPGTIGSGGQKEKSIVLETARAIKRELEKTGNYRVLLTRDRGCFYPPPATL